MNKVFFQLHQIRKSVALGKDQPTNSLPFPRLSYLDAYLGLPSLADSLRRL